MSSRSSVTLSPGGCEQDGFSVADPDEDDDVDLFDYRVFMLYFTGEAIEYIGYRNIPFDWPSAIRTCCWQTSQM